MTGIKELVVSLPIMAKCYQAERFSRGNELILNDEFDNPNSVWARQPGEGAYERILVGFCFEAYCPEETREMVRYGRDLVVFASLSIDRNTGIMEMSDEDYFEMKTELESREYRFPGVKKILPVERASTLSFWAP